jgi:hypothetical protein
MSQHRYELKPDLTFQTAVSYILLELAILQSSSGHENPVTRAFESVLKTVEPTLHSSIVQIL